MNECSVCGIYGYTSPETVNGRYAVVCEDPDCQAAIDRDSE